MRWLIDASIRFRGLVLAAGVALMLFGLAQLASAPVDALPEFKDTVVEVQTEALGLSAEEVEQFITVPLEQDLLNGIAFLDDIESVSLPGLSSIVMTFESGTSLLDARQVVAERLTQAVGVAGLPNVASLPQMLQPLSSTNRVAFVRLSPQELSPIQTSVLARWVIGPRLLGVEGVANVSIFGERDRQIQVLVDPARLAAEGTGLSEVIHTAGNALEVSPLSYLEASKPGTGGFIDTVNQRFQVFHEQSIVTEDELALVPLEDEEGNPVFRNGEPVILGSVADIVEDHQPLIGDALCSDGDCQLLVVEKFPHANTVAVTDGIEEAVTAMRPGLDGIEIDTSIFRPAEYVNEAVANVRTTAIVGVVLALVAVAAFLFSWRNLAVVLISLLVSVGVAGVVLSLFDTTLNVMVLAGLAIGLLVVIDDAVIDVTRLSRRLHAAEDSSESALVGRIRNPVLDLRTAAVYAAVITAIVSVPIFSMDGVAGAFLPPIVATYLLAITVSLVVAATLTPALAGMMIDGWTTPPAVRAINRFYDAQVAPRLASTTTAVAVVAAVVVAGAIALPFVTRDANPALTERNLVIELDTAAGTSLTRMTDLTEGVVDAVAAVDGVRTVGAHIGRAITSDEIGNVNSAEVWLRLDSGASWNEAVAAVEAAVPQSEGLVANVTTHSEQRIRELLGQPSDDIAVRVYGESQAILEEKAAEIETAIGRIDGVGDLRTDHPPTEQTVTVTVDLPAAQAVGLKPGDVRRQSAILLNGITVGNLFDEQKVFDVVVWGTPELRSGTVEDLAIETDAFGPVPLGSVADIEVGENLAEIRHESVITYLDVLANVEGRAVQDVAEEVRSVIAAVDFPREYHAALLGGFDERRAQSLLMWSMWVGAALFAVLLLQAALNSWRLAAGALVAVMVPLSAALIAVRLTGGVARLGAMAGMLVVFGFAVRRILLLIRHYQYLQRVEGIPFGVDLVVRGTRDRLAPMLTASIAGIAFLLPFAVRGQALGLETMQPLAVSVIGGLLGAIAMSLTAVPVLYRLVGSPEDASTWGEELLDLTVLEDQVAGDGHQREKVE